ncbi:tol-pal system-associated acyl-CoA thioesterase [Marinivivus vitaminiproducens]|uniref:tol-pal system-associated acyl-CoA thioesterase n=1 Tax=Marinivivus vitaminiproducens TaxID=3035935 RepID=UPI00279C9DAC|nr:tol-pal system-associated acyl-CoA thioesterase [Geminicoccaceae bacterium SCSIO 64248]
MTQGKHRLNLRVYYEDTDAGGIVYHASYLRFAERARTEMMRSLGVEQVALREDRGLSFVVRDLSIRYRAPARLDDVVAVDTELRRLGAASLTLRQEMTRGTATLVEIDVNVAVIGRSLRPARLPGDLHALLAAASARVQP